MFASHKIAAGFFALVVLGLSSSAMARVDCRPHDRACIALHGPSTPAERARTRALNREALESVAPPARFMRPSGSYAQALRQYEREMRDYARAERRYDMETRRRGNADYFSSSAR